MEKRINGGVIVGLWEEPCEACENTPCERSADQTDENTTEVKKTAKTVKKTAQAKK